MDWSAAVITTASSDTEPSIVVTFGSAKYIFNAGENSSRAWHESRRSLRKSRCVFLTSVGTQHGSGLAGLLMTLADASITKLNVTGPSGMLHLLAQMRSYVWREQLEVDPVEVNPPISYGALQPQPVYADENITLYGIPVTPELPVISIDSELEISEAPQQDSNKRKRSPSPDLSSKRSVVEDPRSSPASRTDGQPLESGIDSEDLDSHTLVGEEAQLWRKSNIYCMFRTPKSLSNEPRGKAPQSSEPLASSSSTVEPVIPDTERPSDDRSHLKKQLPTFQHPLGQEKSTLCYVCVGPRVRGKFDAKKAEQLGVPRGPLRGELSQGKTITFTVKDSKGGPIERTVRAEECVGPPEAPKVIMVFDVPTPEHIPSLVSAFENSTFYSHFVGVEHRQKYIVHSIFHLCGQGVLEDERYKSLLGRFAPDVHHVVASREHIADPVTFTHHGFNQLRLSQLDSEMFPVPQYNTTPAKSLANVPGLPANIYPMAVNLLVPLRPLGPPRQDLADFDKFSPAIAQPLNLSAAILDAYERAREDAKQVLASRTPKLGDNVMVTPLGTGSSLPTRYRNVSSTLIQIPGKGNMLLDAGEGTWGQLTRLFGDDLSHTSGAWQVLRDIKCIFLSHLHGDHHIGLAKLLAMRRKLDPPPSEPIYVIGLPLILLYLREYQQLEDLGLDNEDGAGTVMILSDAISSHQTKPDIVFNEPWMEHSRQLASHEDMCRTLGLHNLITVPVRHRARCFGAVLQSKDGWSITFSGDTMPSDSLINEGMDSTLLIHEATMEDSDIELATKKAHSTIGQALYVGRRMRAENILLTHFSARYPKISKHDTSDVNEAVVALAFDHCRIRIGEMAKLRAYLPAIQQCFNEFKDEDDGVDESHTTW